MFVSRKIKNYQICRSCRSVINLGQQITNPQIAKNIGSANRKSANCPTCGRSANVTNFVSPKICGLGNDSWKNLKQNILWHCPFKAKHQCTTVSTKSPPPPTEWMRKSAEGCRATFSLRPQFQRKRKCMVFFQSINFLWSCRTGTPVRDLWIRLLFVDSYWKRWSGGKREGKEKNEDKGKDIIENALRRKIVKHEYLKGE
jgi:hypothetical protein